MKKIWMTTVALAALGLLAGCTLIREPRHETSYYDLAPLKVLPQDVIAVGLFNNATPARQRMLYREAGGKVVHDEYNLWAQSPEAMLSRYWFNLLPLERERDPKQLLRLHGVLTGFEIDLVEKQVELAINYEFSAPDLRRTGSLSCREKFTEETPEAFAHAFAVCAERMGAELLEIGRQLAQKDGNPKL